MRQVNNGPFLTDDEGRKIVGFKNPDGTEHYFGVQYSASDAVALRSASRGTCSTQKPFSYAGQAVSSGVTLVTQHAADDYFYAVQLFYGNWGGSTYDITTAKIAATPTHTDLGNTATWLTVTFPSAATCPVSSGAGNDIVPGLLVSNVIAVQSVARTDDTTKKPLLQCRTYYAAAASAGQVGASDIASFNASSASNGFQYASRSPAGDQTGTFTASQQPLETGTWIAPMAVKFFYTSRSFLLACVGDSLTRGQGSTANANGWPIRVTSNISRTTGIKATAANFAWTGQTHAASIEYAKTVITTFKPDALTFFAWSPNDAAAGSHTQAIFDAAWSRTLEIVELCRQNRITPVICTSGPWNSLNAAEDARRQEQNIRVRSLANLAVIVDVASVIENTSDRSEINSAYDSGDGLHYNNAGYAAIASVAYTALREII